MLDRNDRDDAASDVLSVEVLVLLLQDSEFSRVLVDHARKSGLEARNERSAVHYVNAVAVGIDLLGKAVIVLESNLDLDVSAPALNVNGLGMQSPHFTRKIRNEALDSFIFTEGLLKARVLVGEGQSEALVQIRGLLELLDDDLGLELGRVKYGRVGIERNCGTGIALRSLAGHGDHAVHKINDGASAVMVLVAVDLAVTAHLNDEARGKRVNYRCAYSVQTAGYLINRITELTARVEYRINDTHRGDMFGRMDVCRDAASVVRDTDAAVL